MKFVIIALLAIVAVQPAFSKQPRSYKAKHQFVMQTPCPATGLRTTKCAGFVIDHVIPLCAGGLDAPVNMQWQEKGESKIKDRQERTLCRSLRHK